MPTSVAIGFPWGRYHATPWGRHVNEAAVEWPPSPWRLLRALYATWLARCPDLAPGLVHGLLADLSPPPWFVLPAAVTEAHTRHYMPDGSHLGRVAPSTDKAFDAFAVMERDAEVVVTWPVDLEPDRREALSRLAALVPYLGRSESVCSLRLLAVGEPLPVGVACHPLDDREGGSDAASPSRRVLLPRLPLDVESLTVRTPEVRSRGRLDPPGAYWGLYDPVPAAPSPAAVSRSARRPRAQVNAARWAIVGPALPSVYAAVAMCDILRKACMSKYGLVAKGKASACLAGKRAAEGSTGAAPTEAVPLEGHGHAHYLATDSDGDQLIDHLTVWAPGGFDDDEVAALVRVDRLTGYSHVPDFRPVRLAVEGVGAVASVAPDLVGPARRWKSVTPFAPANHQHKNQSWADHLARGAIVELRWRGLPEPVSVTLAPGPWLDFRRHRPTSEKLAGARRAGGVEIVFAEPVAGPLALGKLGHFGLGLLLPHGDDHPGA